MTTSTNHRMAPMSSESRKSYVLRNQLILVHLMSGGGLIVGMLLFCLLRGHPFDGWTTLFMFLVVAGLAVTTHLFSHRFTVKIIDPLTKFRDSATKVARGDFTQTIDISSDDEIGRLAKIFNYMTTELRRLNEMNLNQIINEKNKTETIIRNIVDGIIVTDPKNRIMMLNDVAEGWLDLNEGDAVGKPINDFITDLHLLELMAKVSSNGRSEDASADIILRRRQARKEMVLQAKAARVVRKDGELLGLVTVLRDVTKEKEIDRLKTELVSMVAHELRSPLTSISGFSELLLDGSALQEPELEYARIIYSESARLGEMINKFLDISRIESGKNPMNMAPINVAEIVLRVVETNKKLAEQKRIRVKVKMPRTMSAVLADPDMLSQVVLNLFSNAVKYSPENTEMSLRVHESANTVQVEVVDQGYGISDQALTDVFKKFYRADDNEAVREIVGTGLGLALVKEIVEQHDGEVGVESEIGKGSRFYFELPKIAQTEVRLEGYESAAGATAGTA